MLSDATERYYREKSDWWGCGQNLGLLLLSEQAEHSYNSALLGPKAKRSAMSTYQSQRANRQLFSSINHRAFTQLRNPSFCVQARTYERRKCNWT